MMAAARVLAFAFALVATRVVGAEGVARYSVVLAAATVCSVFADLGTSTAITRLVSRMPDRAAAILGGTLLASTLLGIAGYALGFTYFLLADTAADAGDWAIGGLQVIGNATLSSLAGARAGRGRLVRRAAVQFIASGISFGGGALVLGLLESVDAALAVLAAGPAVAVFAAIVALRRSGAWPRRLRLDSAELRTLLSQSLPFAALAGTAVLIARADLLLLAVVSDAAETARYELALRTVEGLGFVTLALSPATVYLLSRRLAAGDVAAAQRAFDSLTQALLLAGVGLSAVIAPLAHPLAATAYGQDLRSVGVPLAVLAAFLWLAFRVAGQGGLLTSSEAPHRVIPLGLAMVGINLVLVVALLPAFDAAGAAWATVLTQAVATVLYDRTAVRLTGVRTALPPVRVILAGLLTAGVTWLSRDLPLVAAGAIGIATYLGAAWALGAIRREDARQLRALLMSR